MHHFGAVSFSWIDPGLETGESFRLEHPVKRLGRCAHGNDAVLRSDRGVDIASGKT